MVADALQFDGKVDGGDHGAQVAGQGLLGREYDVGLFFDLEAQTVDVGVPGDHLFGQGDVVAHQGGNRLTDGRVDHTAEGQHGLAKAV